jgi:hypothetical protein
LLGLSQAAHFPIHAGEISHNGSLARWPGHPPVDLQGFLVRRHRAHTRTRLEEDVYAESMSYIGDGVGALSSTIS